MLTEIMLAKMVEMINQTGLVLVKPMFQYVDNKATDTVIGYKYIVVLPNFCYEKLEVKIDGELLVDHDPEQGAIPVILDDLKLTLYTDSKTGKVAISARASNIHLVK